MRVIAHPLPPPTRGPGPVRWSKSPRKLTQAFNPFRGLPGTPISPPNSGGESGSGQTQVTQVGILAQTWTQAERRARE